MIRAGAVARKVLMELEEMGCDTTNGCPDMADTAKAAFAGRTLSDYYTEGVGSGLSFQELEGYGLVTTSTVVLQSPNDGDHYGPAKSLLEGTVDAHDNGMAELAIDECTGEPVDFDVKCLKYPKVLKIWAFQAHKNKVFTSLTIIDSEFNPELNFRFRARTLA